MNNNLRIWRRLRDFESGGWHFCLAWKAWYSKYSLCKITDRLNTTDISLSTATAGLVIWDSFFPTNSYTFKQALTDLTPTAYFPLLFVSLPYHARRKYSDPVQFDTKYMAEIGLERVIWNYIFRKEGLGT